MPYLDLMIFAVGTAAPRPSHRHPAHVYASRLAGIEARTHRTRRLSGAPGPLPVVDVELCRSFMAGPVRQPLPVAA